MLKAITVRLDEDLFNRLELMSKENKVSLNKVILNIIDEYIKSPKEMFNCFDTFNKKLDEIIDTNNKISKRQIAHIKVSKQHFANRGFLSNAEMKEDKCLKELLGKDNMFND